MVAPWMPSRPVLAADIDHRIAQARGGRIEDLVGLRDADRHRVDEDVAVIARVEIALAADGRHADAIAIAADAGDDAGHRDAASSDDRGCRSAAR